MARDNSQATQASQTGNQFATTYGGNANSIFSDLSPELMAQASHPQGMSPTDKAAADTASEESAGGTEGAAVGSGLLRAARTRNAGGADAAMGASARTAGAQLSSAALKTQLENASLKQKEQAGAESELGGMYGTSVSGGNQALGEVANNVNANTNAENASWDWAKDLFNPIMSDLSYSKGGVTI